jgi:hypothetical protein
VLSLSLVTEIPQNQGLDDEAQGMVVAWPVANFVGFPGQCCWCQWLTCTVGKWLLTRQKERGKTLWQRFPEFYWGQTCGTAVSISLLNCVR